MGYQECINAGQIYKKVISGEKPECFELVKDKQIKAVIENCINVDPNERSSAKDLLLTDFFVSHSFQLESKLSDTNDQILKFELIQAPDPNKNLKESQSKSTLHEDEAIEFEYNIEKDTPAGITEMMLKSGILDAEDREEVKHLLEHHISKLSNAKTNSKQNPDSKNIQLSVQGNLSQSAPNLLNLSKSDSFEANKGPIQPQSPMQKEKPAQIPTNPTKSQFVATIIHEPELNPNNASEAVANKNLTLSRTASLTQDFSSQNIHNNITSKKESDAVNEIPNPHNAFDSKSHNQQFEEINCDITQDSNLTQSTLQNTRVASKNQSESKRMISGITKHDDFSLLWDVPESFCYKGRLNVHKILKDDLDISKEHLNKINKEYFKNLKTFFKIDCSNPIEASYNNEVDTDEEFDKILEDSQSLDSYSEVKAVKNISSIPLIMKIEFSDSTVPQHKLYNFIWPKNPFKAFDTSLAWNLNSKYKNTTGFKEKIHKLETKTSNETENSQTKSVINTPANVDPDKKPLELTTLSEALSKTFERKNQSPNIDNLEKIESDEVQNQKQEHQAKKEEEIIESNFKITLKEINDKMLPKSRLN